MTEAGLWRDLHHVLLDELGSQGLLDWSRAVVDGASVRAKKGGSLTGPIEADYRSRSRSPLRTPTTRSRSSRLVMAIPAVKSRRGPRRERPAKVHADKAYAQLALRAWVRAQGIAVRIARKGRESTEKLGQHRWVIERTIAWLTGYRRLTLRYERQAQYFLAFPRLGAALNCWKKLHKHAI